MSWRIETKGKREDVVKTINAAKDDTTKDQSQIESAKKTILDEVASVSEAFDGVLVRASGDIAPTQRNVSITVHAIKLAEQT